MVDLFKKGTYVETPYNNFYEIKAKGQDKSLVDMAKYSNKVLLVVNVSPTDSISKSEINGLNKLKNKFLDEDFDILAFPTSQIDRLELTDDEMKSKMTEFGDLKFPVFNRV